MSYPSVLNSNIQDLSTYMDETNTIGKFNTMSCYASFNFLEMDMNTSTRNKIAFGIPILEYHYANAEEIPISKSKRIGQIIWEMDRDKYFDYIYKPKNIHEKSFGFIPYISAAQYPLYNDGQGEVLNNLGLGITMQEDWDS